MKQHYLIQIPPRKSGIYLILNLLKKKAYVGLAQDFCNRALDHFKALSITKDGETTISVNQRKHKPAERNRTQFPSYPNL